MKRFSILHSEIRFKCDSLYIDNMHIVDITTMTSLTQIVVSYFILVIYVYLLCVDMTYNSLKQNQSVLYTSINYLSVSILNTFLNILE